MKALIIKSILILLISTGFSKPKFSMNDSLKTIIAQYEGFDESGYTFSYDNDQGDIEYITFETISEEFLKIYDFNENEFFDEQFEIKYRVTVTDDEYGIETYILDSIKLIQ